MIRKILTNLEELTIQLQKKGIGKEQLLIIRKKLEKKNDLVRKVNQLREKRNQLSTGPQNSQKVSELKEEINKKEEELTSYEKEIKKLVDQIPNAPEKSVPLIENKIIDQTKYDHQIEHNFSYEEIVRKLKIIDEEKSIKLSGSKFAVYQGLGSRLVHSLINFMLAEQQKKGYQLFTLPYLVKEHNLYHTGQLPKFKEDLFKLENSDFYLIPTAEIPLVNLYQNEILSDSDLPLKLCAYTPCFRAEAGAAGQESKGLIRLHQFHKVEMVRFTQPENSYQNLEEMLNDARHILHLLKIPHRVIELSCQELGFSAAKTYDIEMWLPASKRWLEISSCSNCEDFQTERAMIRAKNEKGQKYYPHSLNGSGLPVDRLIVALLEYYYHEEENQLIIPEILKNYLF